MVNEFKVLPPVRVAEGPNLHNDGAGTSLVWLRIRCYGVVLYVKHIIWCVILWYGMVCYGIVWCGVVCYGMVWCVLVWYGMVWCGMVGLTLLCLG